MRRLITEKTYFLEPEEYEVSDSTRPIIEWWNYPSATILLYKQRTVFDREGNGLCYFEIWHKTYEGIISNYYKSSMIYQSRSFSAFDCKFLNKEFINAESFLNKRFKKEYYNKVYFV